MTNAVMTPVGVVVMAAAVGVAAVAAAVGVVAAAAEAVEVAAAAVGVDSWDLNNFLWKSNKQDMLMSFFLKCRLKYGSLFKYYTVPDAQMFLHNASYKYFTV